MNGLQPLINALNALRANAQEVVEETSRLRIEGASLNAVILEKYRTLQLQLAAWGATPSFLVSEEAVAAIEPDEEEFYEGQPWRVVIGKDAIAQKLSLRESEKTILFFSVETMTKWAESLDPFLHNAPVEPDFSQAVTIRVVGLPVSFGGASLWILPAEADAPASLGKPTKLPEASAVLDVIHLNADRHLQVSPSSWALTWGDLHDEVARPWCMLSCMVLSACLVQELRRILGSTHGTLKGTKRVTLPLVGRNEKSLHQLCVQLIAAVEWVYEERAETRLRLVMDRLSIDVDTTSTLVAELRLHLANALQQAQDSYAFVILDRKDAYHKELRELMKDMKAQADLYAAKVRDLVASITRDTLGVLVLIGFSFLGKFDSSNLRTLLESAELGLLLRCLSIYLVVSFIMQWATHWRDASLAYQESLRWLSVLQSYTSKSDSQSNFLEPLNKRRKTLNIALILSGMMYAALAFAVWHLPTIVLRLLPGNTNPTIHWVSLMQ